MAYLSEQNYPLTSFHGQGLEIGNSKLSKSMLYARGVSFAVAIY